MIFELTVLGSSSALPTSKKFPSAHVLNVHGRFFLIDCGEGTQIQLRKSGIKYSRINHIFISHMHGDHVFGLFGLLSTFSLLGRKYPLLLFGPPGLKDLLDFFLRYFADGLSYEIQFKSVENRDAHIVYEDKLIQVTAFPLKHRVTTFGYLFREKPRPLNIRKDMIKKYQLSVSQIQDVIQGKDIEVETGRIVKNSYLTQPPYKTRSYAYCSDTSVYKKNTKILNSIDLLYHEATFSDADKKLAKNTGHSTARQAAEMALEAQAGKLLIGHFSTRYKDPSILLNEARNVFPETQAAEELSSYVIPITRISSTEHSDAKGT